jgi:purine-nucleoside phosphorylase
MTPSYQSKVKETTEFIQTQLKEPPVFGILTGTGLGDIASSLDVAAAIDYREVPNFPQSTVESHLGRLCTGHWMGKPVMVFQGRFHLYEGYTPLQVTFPIRVMQALGVKVLILSNAAGGLNPSFTPGDIMVIKDHLNLTGANPLVGPNEDSWGDRFPDMSAAYDEVLAAVADIAGNDCGLHLRTGVYAGLLGPSLETPAEVRYLQTIGADAVGFSTVNEAIAGVHAGMRVLGLSIITNVHHPDAPEPASVAEIIELAQRIAPKIENIIQEVIRLVDV